MKRCALGALRNSERHRERPRSTESTCRCDGRRRCHSTTTSTLLPPPHFPLHSIPSAGVRRQVPVEREAGGDGPIPDQGDRPHGGGGGDIGRPDACFDFPPPEPLGLPSSSSPTGFNYPGQPNLFKNVNGRRSELSRRARRTNGIGKSTLLKLVLGDLEPVAGAVHRHGKLRLGRFSQHHVDQLDLSLTALEHFSRWPQAKPWRSAPPGHDGDGGQPLLAEDVHLERRPEISRRLRADHVAERTCYCSTSRPTTSTWTRSRL